MAMQPSGLFKAAVQQAEMIREGGCVVSLQTLWFLEPTSQHAPGSTMQSMKVSILLHPRASFINAPSDCVAGPAGWVREGE